MVRKSNRFARRQALLSGALALTVYATTMGGSLATTDAVVTYELTKNLVEHASIAGSPDVMVWPANRGVDGRAYSQFGIGQSLYGMPFYLAGRFLMRVVPIGGGRPDLLPKAIVAAGNTIAAAACVWVAWLFGWRLAASCAGGTVAALSLAFGTLLWPYSKFGYNAPLATLCLLGATYSTWVGVRLERPRALILSGACAGAGLLTRHEFLVGALLLGAWIVIESHRRRDLLAGRLARFGTPFVAALIVWMAYNHIRFGTLFFTGYTPGFGSPIAGLSGLLMSPGASVVLYSPVVLAGAVALARCWRADRGSALLLTFLVVGFLLFYATLDDWQGGRSYGPRYLVPLLPFLCIPLGHWFHTMQRPAGRHLLVAFITLSALVQVPGVLVDFSKLAEQRAVQTGESHVERAWSWTSASIVLNTRAVPPILAQNSRYLLGLGAPPPVPDPAGGRDFARQFGFSLDFWWMYLFYLGAISAPAAVMCSVVLLATAALLASRLRQEAGREGM